MLTFVLVCLYEYVHGAYLRISLFLSNFLPLLCFIKCVWTSAPSLVLQLFFQNTDTHRHTQNAPKRKRLKNGRRRKKEKHRQKKLWLTFGHYDWHSILINISVSFLFFFGREFSYVFGVFQNFFPFYFSFPVFLVHQHFLLKFFSYSQFFHAKIQTQL